MTCTGCRETTRRLAYSLALTWALLAQPYSLAQQAERYTGPIIDMHVHAFDAHSGFVQMLGQVTPTMGGNSFQAPVSLDDVREATFKKFTEHNIVKAVVSEGEAWHALAPDVVIIGGNNRMSIEDLRTKHAAGKLHALAEVAPNYDGIVPTDPVLAPFFDLARELKIPMGYHLFPGGPPGGAYSVYPKTRARQAKPLQMEEVLLARPDMKIYIMHAGWPFLEDMKALMYAHPQVYVETGVIDWILTRDEFHHFLKGLVDAGFGKRIMFGSDQMIWPDTITAGIDAVNSAKFLSVEQKADIFYNNAARFLELSAKEIARHQTHEG